MSETLRLYAHIPDSSIPDNLVLAYEKVYPGTLDAGFHADLAWLLVAKLQGKHFVEFDLAYETSHASGMRIYSLANQLNNQLTKRQCIYGYMSQAWFGQDIKGADNAARFYYQKELKNLNQRESLELVIITINPSLYDKIKNPEELNSKINEYY